MGMQFWSQRGVLPFLAAIFLLASCGGEDERPPTFTYVYETIIAPSCATIGCHNDFSQTYGFRFSTKEGAYVGLTGRACNDGESIPGEPPGNYVRAGHPDRSLLISLMRGDDVTRRMPPDRGISGVDITLVEDWILEGAKCD